MYVNTDNTLKSSQNNGMTLLLYNGPHYDIILKSHRLHYNVALITLVLQAQVILCQLQLNDIDTQYVS